MFGGWPLINKLPPFKGCNISIPMMITVKGRGLFESGVCM